MSTKEIVKLLHELGYEYEKNTNNFWHIDSEVYFDLPLEKCDNITDVIKRVIDFEKHWADYRGKNAIRNQMKDILNIRR